MKLSNRILVSMKNKAHFSLSISFPRKNFLLDKILPLNLCLSKLINHFKMLWRKMSLNYDRGFNSLPLLIRHWKERSNSCLRLKRVLMSLLWIESKLLKSKLKLYWTKKLGLNNAMPKSASNLIKWLINVSFMKEELTGLRLITKLLKQI
jgi:hypothetical protein